MDQMKYVIAGNGMQYQHYIRSNRLSGLDYRYVSDIDSIRGLSDISGVFTGTWYDREDIMDIINQIMVIKSRHGAWTIPKEIISFLLHYKSFRP
jgi:hypothetical protein